ncbi:MAG TPA: DUF421 domain-containing protein [Oscillospiraceae bacterium]|nr:DUF421 domain-containing protein [Oscillospiraceae bacterium]HPS75912.1 DUF421 domain-containing protein [Oscillospiraceae bacterium]
MAIVFFRTLIVYFSLLAAMRLMGKRQLGEMELSEFIVAVLIADLASHPLQDIGIPMLNGLIPIFTLFCLEVVISGVSLRHVRLRGILYGRPSVIISHGKIRQSEMRKNRFTLDELTQELRNQSILDIATIEYAILETNGQLNIVLQPADRPATAGQLGIAAPDTGYPTIVINDGRVLSENLARAGYNDAWLQKQLNAAKIASPQKVYLMTVDGTGGVYVAPMEEK